MATAPSPREEASRAPGEPEFPQPSRKPQGQLSPCSSADCSPRAALPIKLSLKSETADWPSPAQTHSRPSSSSAVGLKLPPSPSRLPPALLGCCCSDAWTPALSCSPVDRGLVGAAHHPSHPGPSTQPLEVQIQMFASPPVRTQLSSQLKD